MSNCALAHATESSIWAERRKQLAEVRHPGNLLAGIHPEERLGPGLRLAGVTTKNLSFLTPFGSIRKILKPKSPSSKSQFIIHIQDIHMNAEAQRNIGQTVQALINNKQVGLIALEGAFDAIDLSPFSSFPNQNTIRKVADYMLEQNKISGPVHALLTTPQGESPSVVGVDDEQHHRANVEAYRACASIEKSTKEKILKWQTDLAQRKSKTFNSKLAAFDQEVDAYRRKTLSMGAYVRLLSKRNAYLSPAIKTFLEALDLETSTEFSKVEQERGVLLTHLLARLNASEKNDLVQASVAYRQGSYRHTDFYAYLNSFCEKKGVRLSQFPAFSSYLRYVLLSDSLDAQALLNEVNQTEAAMYEALGYTPEEKSLVRESRQLYLTSKLVDFGLTREEWGEYKQVVIPAGFRGNDEFLQPFEDFYREAEFRDQAMTENLIGAMSNEQWEIRSNFSLPIAHNVVVLVTGGFHSSGIDEKLTEAGYTVVTFVPKITKVDTQNGAAYLTVFSQEKTPLEKLFEGEKLFLANNPIAPLTKLEMGIEATTAEVVAGTPDAAEAQSWLSKFTGWQIHFGKVKDSLITLFGTAKSKFQIVLSLRGDVPVVVSASQTQSSQSFCVQRVIHHDLALRPLRERFQRVGKPVDVIINFDTHNDVGPLKRPERVSIENWRKGWEEDHEAIWGAQALLQNLGQVYIHMQPGYMGGPPEISAWTRQKNFKDSIEDEIAVIKLDERELQKYLRQKKRKQAFVTVDADAYWYTEEGTPIWVVSPKNFDAWTKPLFNFLKENGIVPENEIVLSDSMGDETHKRWVPSFVEESKIQVLADYLAQAFDQKWPKSAKPIVELTNLSTFELTQEQKGSSRDNRQSSPGDGPSASLVYNGLIFSAALLMRLLKRPFDAQKFSQKTSVKAAGTAGFVLEIGGVAALAFMPDVHWSYSLLFALLVLLDAWAGTRANKVRGSPRSGFGSVLLYVLLIGIYASAVSINIPAVDFSGSTIKTIKIFLLIPAAAYHVARDMKAIWRASQLSRFLSFAIILPVLTFFSQYLLSEKSPLNKEDFKTAMQLADKKEWTLDDVLRTELIKHQLWDQEPHVLGEFRTKWKFWLNYFWRLDELPKLLATPSFTEEYARCAKLLLKDHADMLTDEQRNNFIKKLDVYALHGVIETREKIEKASNAYIKRKLSETLTLEDFFKSVIDPNDQMIFLGETHGEGQDYPQLIRIVKKVNPQLDALFLEVGAKFQPNIDQYMRGHSSYEEAIGKYRTGQTDPEPFRLQFAYKERLDAAKELGLNVFAVDHMSLSIKFYRDQYMADQIAGLYKTGKFRFGLMIVGKGHVSDEGLPSRSLPERLTARKTITRFKKINVIGVQLDREQLERIFGAEHKHLVLQNLDRGFLTPASDPSVTMSYPPKYRWNDFDGTLILKNKDKGSDLDIRHELTNLSTYEFARKILAYVGIRDERIIFFIASRFVAGLYESIRPFKKLNWLNSHDDLPWERHLSAHEKALRRALRAQAINWIWVGMVFSSVLIGWFMPNLFLYQTGPPVMISMLSAVLTPLIAFTSGYTLASLRDSLQNRSIWRTIASWPLQLILFVLALPAIVGGDVFHTIHNWMNPDAVLTTNKSTDPNVQNPTDKDLWTNVWEDDEHGSTFDNTNLEAAAELFFVKFIEDVRRTNKRARFLDLGTGRLFVPLIGAELLHQSGEMGQSEFHGVDFATIPPEKLNTSPGVLFHQLHIEDLNIRFPRANFDAATSSFGFEYSNDLGKTLENLKQVLKPNALFAAIVHDRNSAITHFTEMILDQAGWITDTGIFDAAGTYVLNPTPGNREKLQNSQNKLRFLKEVLGVNAIEEFDALIEANELTLRVDHTFDEGMRKTILESLHAAIANRDVTLELSRRRLDRLNSLPDTKEAWTRLLTTHGFGVISFEPFIVEEEFVGWKLIMENSASPKGEGQRQAVIQFNEANIKQMETSNPGVRDRIRNIFTTSFEKLVHGVHYHHRSGDTGNPKYPGRGVVFNTNPTSFPNRIGRSAVKIKGGTLESGKSGISFDPIQMGIDVGLRNETDRHGVVHYSFTPTGVLKEESAPKVPMFGMRYEEALDEYETAEAIPHAGFEAAIPLAIAEFPEEKTEDGETAGAVALAIPETEVQTAAEVILSLMDKNKIRKLCFAQGEFLYRLNLHGIAHTQFNFSNWGMTEESIFVKDTESVELSRKLTPAQYFGFVVLGLRHSLGAAVRIKNKPEFQDIPINWIAWICEGFFGTSNFPEIPLEEITRVFSEDPNTPLFEKSHWLIRAVKEKFPKLAEACEIQARSDLAPETFVGFYRGEYEDLESFVENHQPSEHDLLASLSNLPHYVRKALEEELPAWPSGKDDQSVREFFTTHSEWKNVLNSLEGLREEGLIVDYAVTGSFSRAGFRFDGSHDLDIAIIPKAGLLFPDHPAVKLVDQVNSHHQKGSFVHLTLEAYGPAYRYDEGRNQLKFQMIRGDHILQRLLEGGNYKGERLIYLGGKDVNVEFWVKLYALLQTENKVETSPQAAELNALIGEALNLHIGELLTAGHIPNKKLQMVAKASDIENLEKFLRTHANVRHLTLIIDESKMEREQFEQLIGRVGDDRLHLSLQQGLFENDELNAVSFVEKLASMNEGELDDALFVLPRDLITKIAAIDSSSNKALYRVHYIASEELDLGLPYLRVRNLGLLLFAVRVVGSGA